jgi:hypothetical protein
MGSEGGSGDGDVVVVMVVADIGAGTDFHEVTCNNLPRDCSCPIAALEHSDTVQKQDWFKI